MGRSFEARLLGTALLTVLAVIALSFTTWRVLNDSSQAAQWVSHTHELLHLLARTRGYTLQTELATQGYRLTGDEANLVERDAAILGRERNLILIKKSIGDNPRQRDRWEQLRKVVDQRLSIAREIERLRRTQGENAASTYVKSAPLRATRTSIYKLLDEMDNEERMLLERRQIELRKLNRTLLFLEIIIAISVCLLLLSILVLVIRQLKIVRDEQNVRVASENNLISILSSIGDAVIVTDVSGQITRLNRMAESMTGWPATDAIGKQLEDIIILVDEDTHESVDLPIAAALATGVVQTPARHLLLISREGNEVPVSDSTAPISQPRKVASGIVLVLRDVATQRQAERAILAQNAQLEQNVHETTHQWHESETHLRDVLTSVPMMIAYVNSNRRYVYVNQQYRARFAPDWQDITNHSVQEVLGDERYVIAEPLITKALRGVAQCYDWQPFPGVWQQINYFPKRDMKDEVVGYYVLGADITMQKLSELRIQTLNEELAQRVKELEHVSRALRTLSAGNRAMLRASHEQELLESMCQAIVQVGHYKMAIIWYRVEGSDTLIYPVAQSGFPGGMEALTILKERLVEGSRGNSVTPLAIRTGEIQVSHNMADDKDFSQWRDQLHGTTSSLSCPLTVEGSTIGTLTIYDIEKNAFSQDEINLLTESSEDLAFGISILRSQMEHENTRNAMQYILRHDPLTGLGNVLLFEQMLTEKLAVCMHEEKPLSTLQFNIERLSEINDVLGIRHGDEVLCDFSRRLLQGAPGASFVARIRGDEFAIILDGCDTHAALRHVDEILQKLLPAYQIAGISIEVTAKVGIALFPLHGATAAELLRNMSKAVNQAKKMGVDVSIYDPGQPQTEAAKLAMVGELRRAIENNEFRLYLQPKLALHNMSVCGAEVLIRWAHPELGLLGPGSFINLAEKTGLIKPLTEWILQAALDLLQRWLVQNLEMPIAVNLSARNLRDEELPNKISAWQIERGVYSGLLELEITESSVMEEPEQSLSLLQAMKDNGLSLYIDDYGTGYSSLKYLQQLPVDYIKIDQSFVTNMSDNDGSALIVQSTIELVKGLGRKTVAEGVESLAVLQQLKALGCDYAQGYLIAKPMPAEQFQSWVSEFDSDRLSVQPDSNYVAHR
ncbi:EAL domain-containing protein [Aeromonas piscicola]|uniref:EAL domain-containing protein n=1 Tax=Aeromonas piscicola TaxID=600645 RepID=A0ABT7QAY7_9GAMM|nr:EAL domain-containing protein [Aeromonas piscicola]MDM5130789.1 EAL domain-containing protein [Aeromonas piscicola]